MNRTTYHLCDWCGTVCAYGVAPPQIKHYCDPCKRRRRAQVNAIRDGKPMAPKNGAFCIRCDEQFQRRTNERMCEDCGMVSTDSDEIRAIARRAVGNAIRQGVIPRANTLTCVDCGKPAFCYDHRRYDEPLNVDPVCKSCDIKRGPGRPLLPNKYGRRDYA